MATGLARGPSFYTRPIRACRTLSSIGRELRRRAGPLQLCDKTPEVCLGGGLVPSNRNLLRADRAPVPFIHSPNCRLSLVAAPSILFLIGWAWLPPFYTLGITDTLGRHLDHTTRAAIEEDRAEAIRL